MTAPARSATRVVVQAAMSLDGFIAGPGDAMDWVFEYAAPEEFPELAQAAGAMLSGRRSYDVGPRDAGKPSGEAYGGAWHGPVFVLTHEPPAGPEEDVTFLSGDIETAVATAKAAAAPGDLIITGADVACSACSTAWWTSFSCSCCRYCSATARGCTRPPAAGPGSS